MKQATFNDIEESNQCNDIVRTINNLERGDRILVNCETEIHVHKNGDYFGVIETEANHPGGARANIGVKNGEAWFDCSQLRDFEAQKERMTRIQSIEHIKPEGGDR